MKKVILQGLAILLVISLLTGMVPIVSSATENELVLTKIGHTNTDTVSITSPTTRSVTLTVPHSYVGNTLDLSTGLIVEKTSSIDSVITSFSSGSAAAIGDFGVAGPAVNMTVAYYKGGNVTTQNSAVYGISVVRAAMKNPTFTGTIAKSLTGLMPSAKANDITFSSGDFTTLYTANDGGSLTNVSITGSSLSCGSLKIGSGSTYVNYVSGRLLSMSDIGNLVFDATGGGTVSYIVSAYAGDDTSTAIGSVVLTIAVNAVKVPTISSTISKSVNAGAIYNFSLTDFSSLYSLHDGTLDMIEMTPVNTNCGVWQNGSSSFTGAATFSASTIGNLKFKSSAAGTAAFTWRVSNEAGFSEPGSGSITVKTAAVPTITSSVVKSVNLDATLTFSLSDFSSCYSLNNGTLSNIVITPTNSKYGTWYKGSAAFTGAKTFDANDIGTLIFKGTLCGQAAFTWTVSNEKGTSTAGGGNITVNPNTSTTNYTTAMNAVKTFSASDFNTACKGATGANLNYIYFTLPAASCGTLYFGYSSPPNSGTAINANSVLYYNKSPKISNVSFVPAANYTGTVTITYTGVNENGIAHVGTVKIIVGNAGDVIYFTAQNNVKTFSSSDFNTACTNVTGSSLSYIYLILPAASDGTLYYGYSSPSNPGTAVSPNSPYSLQNLSYITFVPAANNTGTISIPYTGVSTNNTSYTGYITMTVGSSSAVSYTTSKNTVKTFSVSDFNTSWLNATGTTLSHIILTPPAAAYGAIYYNYSSALSPGTAITSSTNFYVNSAPYISSLTFVPATNYTGTVTLTYIGVSTNGVSNSGSVVIKVTGSPVDISYSTKEDNAIGFSSGDFNTASLNATGAYLDFVYFTLPASTYGKLYYNYSSLSDGHSAVSGTTAYYINLSPIIDNIAFVPAAGYNGTVTVTYVGYNANGTSYTGKVFIQVNKKTGSTHFADVGSSYAWAAGAIDYLFEAGIVKGTGNNKYTPGANITRGDFILMLYNALHFSGSKSSNFPDVPKGSYYYNAIAIAKSLGIAQGYKNKFNPTAPLTRQDAMLLIYKALLLTGETLPTGSSSDISKFTDKENISSYALTAVECLVKAGLITGNNSKINPTGNLSRAEMAVVLYRVKITY